MTWDRKASTSSKTSCRMPRRLATALASKQSRADHLSALLMQKRGGHGAVHAAAHGNNNPLTHFQWTPQYLWSLVHLEANELPIDVLAVINGDDINNKPRVFDTVNDAITTCTIPSVPLPPPCQEFTEGRVRGQTVNGIRDLLAELPVSPDEPLELLLGEFRKDNRVVGRH